MAHIVVVGGGLGGVASAFEMADLVRSEDQVTLISERETLQFTPSNPWVAVRWREPDAIQVALGPVCAQKRIEFISTAAKRLHPAENAIELEDGRRIEYDYLIIATGPKLAFDEVDGLGPDSHTQSICSTGHAVKAASAWDRFVANPGPIVVGAVQGASCFGPAYEFAFIMDADLRKRKIRDKVPMTFVSSEPYIGHLGLGGVGDSKGMMESAMRERHIKCITNARVMRVDEGMMHVAEHDAAGVVIKEHELPFSYSMMLPAFKGIDAVIDIDGLTNPRGFILIDKKQRNPTFKNIYGVGVCVAIPPIEATPVPTGVPKTGYMIETMATAATLNIMAELEGREPAEEPSWNAICLADMGDTGVAFVAMPQIPPRNLNWMKQGKWVHLAKVAFEKYYLHKISKGVSEHTFEKYVLKAMGIEKLR